MLADVISILLLAMMGASLGALFGAAAGFLLRPGWNEVTAAVIGAVAGALLGIAFGLRNVGAAKRWYESRIGKCDHCGYDLTGNVTGVCPECGAGIGKSKVQGPKSKVEEVASTADGLRPPADDD